VGFYKEKKVQNADRLFLDREDILRKIEENVLLYKDNHNFYKLFSFYGMGGIGKSRLVNQIYDTYNGTDLTLYKYHLEILSHETIPSILLHIRRNFTYTPHFDYVLLKYWDYIDYNRANKEIFENIICKSIRFISNTVDNLLLSGCGNLENIVKIILKKYEEREISYSEISNVNRLLQGKMEDLHYYMSQTLAQDIEKELKEFKYVFIFDAYTYDRTSKTIDWLKYFVNNFENGMFIVTSREPLEWFDHCEIDALLVENIPMDSIPQDVVREYLLEEKYSNNQINLIIEKTDCIPLFLDIALTISKEGISDQTFVGFNEKNDLVKHLLSHLSESERTIIEYLAVVRLFNEEVYNNVLDFSKLSCQKYPFSIFKNCTILPYVEEFNGLYKIHSVLSNNISILMENGLRHKIIMDYINFVWARIITNELLYNDIKYNFILNIYILVENEQLLVDTNISEKMLDMYFYLADKSYEMDFINYIISLVDKNTSTLKYIYQYIKGKAERLINIRKGLKSLENIPISECKFGKHIKSLQCDINYLLSISGKYNEAEEKMDVFVNQLNDDDVGQRYYIKGIIYDCDMKMLRGKFISSIEGLLLLTNQCIDQKFLFEINKTIAHSYRFNFLLDKAIEQYSICDTEKYLDYYLTVYCETNCYFNPEQVTKFYDYAIEESTKHNNHNNLGKINYSMAIAKIVKSEYQSAGKYIEKAYNEFKGTKYQAGNLFVLIAEAYLEFGKNKRVSSMMIKKIKKYVESINGIYEYLLLPLYVARKDTQKVNELKEKFEWISYNETIENINKFINQLL
jgi:hypothetical protein